MRERFIFTKHTEIIRCINFRILYNFEKILFKRNRNYWQQCRKLIDIVQIVYAIVVVGVGSSSNYICVVVDIVVAIKR